MEGTSAVPRGRCFVQHRWSCLGCRICFSCCLGCCCCCCSLAGNGFNGTDQVFYFTAINTGSCSDNIIAYTIICHMEPFTYRPNVAAINLCPRFWALTEPNYNKQVSALVHEMVHGLVSRALLDNYTAVRGSSRGQGQQQVQPAAAGAAASAVAAAAAAVLPMEYVHRRHLDDCLHAQLLPAGSSCGQFACGFLPGTVLPACSVLWVATLAAEGVTVAGCSGQCWILQNSNPVCLSTCW